MDKAKLRVFFLAGIMTGFCFLVSYAQPVVKTSTDKNEILIGDQFKVKIEAGFSPEEYKIKWPAIPDSLAHFEVISRSKMDSLYSNERLTGLTQTITLTSFDSGIWPLPSFLVNIVPVKEDTAYNFFTDSVPITVSFSKADSTNRLRDIKPIREVETMNPLWYWIGAGVLLVVLVIFLIWFYRYWKKNKTSVITKTNISPYDEAMKELENLQSYNLAVPGDIKIVHTRLSEITKRYLSRTQKNNYLNKTTGDILISLNEHQLEKIVLAKAASNLRCGDAVKFAKYIPPVSESEECIQSGKEIIQAIEAQHAKPKPKPETVNLKP